MFKNLFLDRDGVINEVVIRNAVVASPRRLEEFQLRTDFTTFSRGIEDRDVRLFVVSNQPDIARGLMDRADLQAITRCLSDQFKFSEILYCDHDDADGCHCRKPKPGMITYLLDKFGLIASESLIVGDSGKDIMAGKAAGIKTVLLRTAYNRELKVQPDYQVSSLWELIAGGFIAK